MDDIQLLIKSAFQAGQAYGKFYNVYRYSNAWETYGEDIPLDLQEYLESVSDLVKES